MVETKNYILEIQEQSLSEIDANEKLLRLKKILERLCKEITQDEPIQFSTLFSRLVFLAQKYRLPKRLEWQLQHLRVSANAVRKKQKQIDHSYYKTAEQAVYDFIGSVSGQSSSVAESEIPLQNQALDEKYLRLYVQTIDREKKLIHCVSENSPGADIIVKYGVDPDNKAFDSCITRFWEGAQINIVDYQINKNGYLIPKLLVLEPDYLIDASSIAECFQDYYITPLLYFRNKFETIENRSYLLLGNLANFFLDELVYADNPEDVSFDEVFFRSFKASPFEYTSCKDLTDADDFRDFIKNARDQFKNIKRVIAGDFPRRGIHVKKCTLEPSFFSEKYGFQGRLDLLQAERNNYKIIELKSGKLPYPCYNAGVISLNHEVQTGVYRFMVESVFDADARNIEAAILYSSGNNEGENLRFVAEFQQLEKEIINLRNLIVANEYALMQGDLSTVEKMFEDLFATTDFAKPSARFYTDKMENFKQILRQCTPLELKYFYRFISFVSRELFLQKIGDIEYESPAGTASLWNSDFTERAEALDVLYDLSIENIDDSGNDMFVVFKRNHSENDIVNFREGEICIVYPRNDEKDNVLNKQILKASLVAIQKDFVQVRFRYKQRNRDFFNDNIYWAIEHDRLDSSVNGMFKSLFSFLQAPKEKRDLLLGLKAPQFDEISSASEYPESIIQKALAANVYFLIVGPPGTGKTSIFARKLVEEIYADKTKNMLVLAYTNRAVDELCEAIHAAFGCVGQACDKYIRIGTELSCDEQFRNRLLQNISEKAENREAIRNEIEKTRIFVSTVASINGKLKLLELKKFDVAIIDEASQILEPQIIGLLPKFEKFIMIGDHNQLSTIVLQKRLFSRVREPELNKIGIVDCRDSLFERLLRNCVKNNWKNATAQLTYQGRMHVEIAAFPGKYFYSDQLFPVKDWQTENLKLLFAKDNSLFDEKITNNRITFFSTENLAGNLKSTKTNEYEADTIISITESIVETYKRNKLSFSGREIGIIAPYRNQIALIRHKLQETDIPDQENIMIDTVERFQGSQRNIMLISFCVNKAYQLNFLCNMDAEGKVDRKLNVALTRARKQMFLVGNARILEKHPVYANLLEFLKNKKIILK